MLYLSLCIGITTVQQKLAYARPSLIGLNRGHFSCGFRFQIQIVLNKESCAVCMGWPLGSDCDWSLT